MIRGAGPRAVSGVSILFSARAQKAKQRQSAGNRQQEKLLDDGTPPEELFARQLLPRLGLKHQHRRKFLKIDSAFVALDAVVLKVMAGGTFVSNRMMTARAELNFLGVFMPAFLATHSRIIRAARRRSTAINGRRAKLIRFGLKQLPFGQNALPRLCM